MVMGNHTAYRYKQCQHVFFTPKAGAQSALNALKTIVGQHKCPKCGSKDVAEDKTVKT